MQKQDGSDYLQGEDESFPQETRVSDEAASHEEALWKSYLQTCGPRLMVTRTNRPENQAGDSSIPIFPIIKKAKL